MGNVRSIADYQANKACALLQELIASSCGTPVEVPQTRAELEKMREKLDGVEHMKDSVVYIDFLLEQANNGAVRLK